MDDAGSRKQRIGLWLAPALALATLLFVELDPADPRPTRMAAVAILMALWWITEAIPIPATALLPVGLFPLLGILPGSGSMLAAFSAYMAEKQVSRRPEEFGQGAVEGVASWLERVDMPGVPPGCSITASEFTA